jgi:hypothetical protein
MTPSDVENAASLLSDRKATAQCISRLQNLPCSDTAPRVKLDDGYMLDMPLPRARLIAALREYDTDLKNQLAKLGVEV